MPFPSFVEKTHTYTHWYTGKTDLPPYHPPHKNSLQNSRQSFTPASLQKYAALYAGNNDGGPLFGGASCRANPGNAKYPICDTQKNCGKCYEVRARVGGRDTLRAAFVHSGMDIAY